MKANPEGRAAHPAASLQVEAPAQRSASGGRLRRDPHPCTPARRCRSREGRARRDLL